MLKNTSCFIMPRYPGVQLVRLLRQQVAKHDTTERLYSFHSNAKLIANIRHRSLIWQGGKGVYHSYGLSLH